MLLTVAAVAGCLAHPIFIMRVLGISEPTGACFTLTRSREAHE